MDLIIADESPSEISDGINLAKSVADGGNFIVSIANLDPYPILLQKQFHHLKYL